MRKEIQRECRQAKENYYNEICKELKELDKNTIQNYTQ